MSLRTSLAALVILFSFAGAAREPSRPVEPLPQAVLPHPIAENDRPLEVPPRWSPQALAGWPGPWVEEHPGPYPPLYDHRYITW
jgi:hypothetical protein